MKSHDRISHVTAARTASPRRPRRRAHRVTPGPVALGSTVAQRLGRKVRAMKREWNREQTTRTGAGAIAVAGTLLGFFVHRAFFLLPAGVAAATLRRPVQRWAPRIIVLGRILLKLQGLRRRVRGALRAAATA